MSDEVVVNLPARQADVAMFKRQKFGELDMEVGVMPKVYLVKATNDPLGSMAAMNEMYRGRIITGMDQLTRSDRERAWEDCQLTHLKAPMESIDFQFMIEGLDRSISHQMVRQRTAVYAQESMRFAMPSEILEETSLPPSLWGTRPFGGQRPGENGFTESEWASLLPEEKDRQLNRQRWDESLESIAVDYQAMIDRGMPAEEARGLLPHAIATRIMYKTNLRNLVEHAGNRLCTQAQFHWRVIFSSLVQAIRTYSTPYCEKDDNWQFRMIANSKLFAPICYQTGKCEFQGSADRWCSIRDRVNAFHAGGVPSERWGDSTYGAGAINVNDWLMDHAAARISR